MNKATLETSTCILIFNGDTARLERDFTEAKRVGINDFLFVIRPELHNAFETFANAQGLGDAWKNRTIENLLRVEINENHKRQAQRNG